MNMKKLINILFLTSIMLQNSCKKDPDPEPVHHFLKLGNFVDYVWAKPGSYWIYKNTKTYELDTHFCNAFKFDTVTATGRYKDTRHITVTYERIRRNIYSTFNKWNIYDKTIDFPPQTQAYSGYNYIDRNVSGEGIITAFIMPFTKGIVFGNGSSNTTVIDTIPSLTLNNKTYYDVVKFDIDLDSQWENTPPYKTSIYYWAKDVGLIKKTSKLDNYSWELIEYNIIK